MGLSVYNNVEAMNSHRLVTNTNMQLTKSIERLSSGLRINRGADDAAGLAVSENMRADIRGMRVAQRNAQDGASLVQVADGAIGNVTNMLLRIRDLSVQANNGTYTTLQRNNLNAEVQQILTEIGQTGANTDFNGVRILSGSVSAAPVTLQVGSAAGQTVAFTIGTVSTLALGITGLSVSTPASASAAIASLDAAINTLNTQRANLGAIQNRLELTIDRLGVTSENLQAAESRIRDADMAFEMIGFTKNQILQQSGMAMLAQANQSPQSVLSLLR
jgi:flagellin